jgi:hypothetical protein
VYLWAQTVTRFVPHDTELDLTAVECDYVALAAVTAVRSAGIRAELTRRREARAFAADWCGHVDAYRFRAILAGAR